MTHEQLESILGRQTQKFEWSDDSVRVKLISDDVQLDDTNSAMVPYWMLVKWLGMTPCVETYRDIHIDIQSLATQFWQSAMCKICGERVRTGAELRRHKFVSHTPGLSFIGVSDEELRHDDVPGQHVATYDIDTLVAAEAAAYELDAHLRWSGPGLYAHVLNDVLSELIPVGVVVERIDEEIERLNLLKASLESIS